MFFYKRNFIFKTQHSVILSAYFCFIEDIDIWFIFWNNKCPRRISLSETLFPAIFEIGKRAIDLHQCCRPVSILSSIDEWVEFGFSFFLLWDVFTKYSRQVFFSYTNTCMVKSNFGVGSVSRSVLVSADNRLTCNISIVALFVGLS